MHDVLGPGTILGYCTNVHPGVSLDEVFANLDRYALPVKQRVSPDAPMGVGLWLSATAVNELLQQERISELRQFLESRGLLAYTFNGFPYGDFHQPIVKHAVYEPDWTTRERYDYTLTLANILAELIPEGGEGSISTLPIGWPSGDENLDRHRMDRAAERLTDLMHQLARLELDTGRHIHINLEPEPGCLLDTADDVAGFFQAHLLGGLDDESVRGYLRVCHDVCHSAVMFEPQRRAIQTYQDAGITIGKAQLSSAVSVNFDDMDHARKEQAIAQLHAFAEEKYLHQTTIRSSDGRQQLIDNLTHALASPPTGEWRVHFHVPLFVDSLGELDTTQSDTSEFVKLAKGLPDTRHFEVETYAWNVLPKEHAAQDLADGIAREIEWVTTLSD